MAFCFQLNLTMDLFHSKVMEFRNLTKRSMMYLMHLAIVLLPHTWYFVMVCSIVSASKLGYQKFTLSRLTITTISGKLVRQQTLLEMNRITTILGVFYVFHKVISYWHVEVVFDQTHASINLQVT